MSTSSETDRFRSKARRKSAGSLMRSCGRNVSFGAMVAMLQPAKSRWGVIVLPSRAHLRGAVVHRRRIWKGREARPHGGAETVANELGPPPEMPDEQESQNHDGSQDGRKQAADRTAESGACLGPLGQNLTQPASFGLALASVPNRA